MKNCFQFVICALLLAFITSCAEQNTSQKSESHQTAPNNTRTTHINNYKSNIDSLNQSLEWKELNCGLWLSNNNMLALKTQQATSETIFIDRYITYCGEQELIHLIDTTTFSHVGSSFYKDQNHVYTHYVTSDGGYFSIVENADVKSFIILNGNHYAKDKRHIYDARNLVMENVDHETFRALSEPGFLGKDKNGYYQWGEKVELGDLSNLPSDTKKKLVEL